MSVLPVLKRFEIVVFKNGTGSTQVPALARVDFYRQGATVSVEVPNFASNETRDIDVYHRGALEDGDVVQSGTDAGVTLTVGPHPTDPRKLRVTNTTPGPPIMLAVGARLVPTGTRPKVYNDPVGETPSNDSHIMTSNADGRGSCYIAAFRFDYIVSGSGLDDRLFIDAEGSFVFRT